ncbi:MAG: hypothetical protein ACPGXL_07770 [Chitinophagales bacterium]
MKKIIFSLLILGCLMPSSSNAAQLLLHMNEKQNDHLKAYGIAYYALDRGIDVDWLLNYEGGSFSMKYAKELELECVRRGVSFKVTPDAQYTGILRKIAEPQVNMDVVKLEKAPKIAVYSPKEKPHHPSLPWDDAVTLVLEYAEIPFDVIYDEEVLDEKLADYEWLHLHHEDFTGQHGKFWSNFRNADWYVSQVKYEEAKAKQLGFNKVSEMKLAVTKKIQTYVAGGGFMFAMCSATDTYDIAMASQGVDICDHMFDGDGADPNAQEKLDYNHCFAFKDFSLKKNPREYEYSSIDVAPRGRNKKLDYFTLFEFSAKWDVIPSMLTQNHTQSIKGFMGQTTAFKKQYVKSDVVVMGENKSMSEVRYIHNEFGKGFWTFYGGHDPEDYQHFVGEPETDLNLHPNSPGYRLILNNVLFPAAKKRDQKT